MIIIRRKKKQKGKQKHILFNFLNFPLFFIIFFCIFLIFDNFFVNNKIIRFLKKIEFFLIQNIENFVENVIKIYIKLLFLFFFKKIIIQIPISKNFFHLLF